MNLAHTTDSIKAFTAAIFSPGDIVEVRRLPSGKSTWHTAAELHAQAATLLRDNAAGQNIYIGANPRKAIGGTKAEDVALARCLFADLDHIDVEDARARLESSPLPPATLLIASGHGVHAYWRLAEPVTDLAEWSELQRNLIAMLRSDPAIHDPPRIMRLAGFVNHKPPAAECAIVESGGAVYEWAELLPLIPRRREAKQTAGNGHRGVAGGATIALGQRNTTLASLAGTMRRRGMSFPAIDAALAEENREKCDPPLDRAEVTSIAQSVCRYHPAAVVSPSPFPIDFFPEPLRAYVAQAAAALGCAAAFVGVPLLAVVAAAIGNTRRIRLKDSWSEPAVIWCATLGESGTVKSPALELATRPVWKRQAKLLRDHAAERAEHNIAAKRWKAAEKSTRGEPPEPPPPCQHPICSDITVEALADRLLATPRGTLVALDEFAGWFAGFNQYKKSGADVPHWLAMHGARALKVDRKTGDKTTIYVPHAAVCLTGTIQPETLRRALLPEFFDNGLAARLLVTMPPVAPKRWTEREIDPAIAFNVDRLFDSLFAIQPDAAPDGEAPKMIDLDVEAKARWIAFVNEHGEQLDALHGAARAAAAKMEGYAARFALIHFCLRSAAGDNDARIGADDVLAGIALATWFEAEAMRVYGVLRPREHDEERQRRELVEWIKSRGGRVTPRELRQHSPTRFPTSDDAELELNQLVADGLGKWEIVPSGGGRPASVFILQTANRKPESADSFGNSDFPVCGLDIGEEKATDFAASDDGDLEGWRAAMDDGDRTVENPNDFGGSVAVATAPERENAEI